MGNESNKNEDKSLFKNIKSKYIFEDILSHITENKLLQIIKHNKSLQTKLNKNIEDYKYFHKIIIEIIPTQKSLSLIHIPKDYESFFHFYFDNNKKEMNSNYFLMNKKKIKKIKIIIDERIKSFNNLFYDCAEKINFLKFNRNDITDMSYMFDRCSSLKELNLDNFNTDNVTNMSYMFNRCSSLKELNLNLILKM